MLLTTVLAHIKLQESHFAQFEADKKALEKLSAHVIPAFLVSKEVPAFVIAESLCVAGEMDPRFGPVQGHP